MRRTRQSRDASSLFLTKCRDFLVRPRTPLWRPSFSGTSSRPSYLGQYHHGPFLPYPSLVPCLSVYLGSIKTPSLVSWTTFWLNIITVGINVDQTFKEKDTDVRLEDIKWSTVPRHLTRTRKHRPVKEVKTDKPTMVTTEKYRIRNRVENPRHDCDQS